MDNWKTYPLHKPTEGKIYTTINLENEKKILKFRKGLWYETNGRICLSTPIKFKDEN